MFIFLGDFSFVVMFSIGCGSKFRDFFAYLEVGSSDLKPIHEKTIFDEIQVFLLVRGGLRRKILVENGILNLENGRFMKTHVF